MMRSCSSCCCCWSCTYNVSVVVRGRAALDLDLDEGGIIAHSSPPTRRLRLLLLPLLPPPPKPPRLPPSPLIVHLVQPQGMTGSGKAKATHQTAGALRPVLSFASFLCSRCRVACVEMRPTPPVLLLLLLLPCYSMHANDIDNDDHEKLIFVPFPLFLPPSLSPNSTHSSSSTPSVLPPSPPPPRARHVVPPPPPPPPANPVLLLVLSILLPPPPPLLPTRPVTKQCKRSGLLQFPPLGSL